MPLSVYHVEEDNGVPKFALQADNEESGTRSRVGADASLLGSWSATPASTLEPRPSLARLGSVPNLDVRENPAPYPISR